MKKYLISGVAALAMCFAFTSCSHDLDAPSEKDVHDFYAQKIVNTYNQAFLNYIGGEISPMQDWGFGAAYSARTRADGEFANYHGEYADAHLWTSKGFHAPDALTPGQKLRVQFYFQTVKNPGGTHDYGIIDFFMQQVYDGCTDPITKYNGYTSPAYSLEEYPAANGRDYIQSGEHMDHLVAGDNNTIEHINNFNNGNFPDPIDNVANWNQTVQDNHSQEHEDQIMLMLNTPTNYFSYANSDASYVRKDRWTLVSGDVIDDYCDNVNNAGWKAFLAAHSGVVDDPCYDEWERSYIGFDFDMLPSEDLYVEGQYFWIPFDGKNQTQVYNGTQLVDLTTVGEIGYVYGNPVFFPFKEGTTEKIPVLTDKTNMYCGTPETWNDADGKYVYTDNGTSYLRVDYVYQALDDIKMPVLNNHRQWVTIGNCNDGYYSDWIVSFLPAEPKKEEPVYADLRVIAEDLSASDDTDFDFNDIVFDVYYARDNETTTKVVVIAAGGTLPLRIKVKSTASHDDEATTGAEGNGWQEVHALWSDIDGIGTGTMINTGAEAKYGFPKGADNRGSREITIYWPVKNAAEANGITIEVLKTLADGTTQWCEMRAEKGQPAAKLAVDRTFTPLPERQSIKGVYNKIVDWAQSGINSKWW